jgi:hypothetical protein
MRAFEHKQKRLSPRSAADVARPVAAEATDRYAAGREPHAPGDTLHSQGPALTGHDFSEVPLYSSRASHPPGRTGDPLAEPDRRAMEAQFGAPFGEVRIHRDDGQAERHHAQALTRGADVHFARGRSPSDRFLLGHELTHVVQQRRGNGALPDANGLAALESEATQAGRRVARGEPAGPVQGRAAAQPLRFGAKEHRDMGDAGSGGRMVALAEDYSITYGQMTALAGDHFESIQQMREFAARKSGKESREEIEYAIEWQLGLGNRRYTSDDSKKEAKKFQEQRYYTLAGKNDAHFPNPNAGDMARTTAAKAGDVNTDKGSISRWWPKGKPKNAIAAFRLNHVQAINEALSAGKSAGPIDSAMATDAFGSHYLTDSFSSGHIRTERTAIREYWNARVPMFYFNFIGYLSEKIAEQLNNTRGYNILSEEALVKGPLWFDGAADTVRQKIGSKGRLDFGDIVALALHDYDNSDFPGAPGVEAVSEGRDVKLFGDGAAGTGDEKALAIRAVKLSCEDIDRAYAIGKAGGKTADELIGDDGLFAPERVIPIPATGPGKNVANPLLDWRKAAPRALLEDGYFQKAVFQFCQEKAEEVQKVADEMGGAKKRALERAIISQLHDKMKCVNLIWAVINWTPNTGGGIGGHNTDDNAADYYDAAAKTAGGVHSLTPVARINLIRPLMSGVWVADDEEERIWYLLDTAPPADAREVIKHIGWSRIADALEGAEDRKFRAKFPQKAYE